MLRPYRAAQCQDIGMRELDSSWSAQLDAWLADTAHVKSVLQATCALLLAGSLTLLAQAQLTSPFEIQGISVGATTEIRGVGTRDLSALQSPERRSGPKLPREGSRSQEFAPIVMTNAPLAKNSIVRRRYAELAAAYLCPFKGNSISRLDLMNFMLGSGKLAAGRCAGCFLVQVKNGEVYAYDPRSVRNSSAEFRRLRMRETIHWISRAVDAGAVQNTEFVVSIVDDVASTSRNHKYSLPGASRQSLPIFTIARCNVSDNIPFPMIFGDLLRRGFPDKYWRWKTNKVREWDDVAANKIGAHSHDDNVWGLKREQAIFRGTIRSPAYLAKPKRFDEMCDDAGRTGLFARAEEHKEEITARLRSLRQRYVFWRMFYQPSTWLAPVSNFIQRARRVAAIRRDPELATYQADPQSRTRRRAVRPDMPLLDVQIEGKCGSRIYKSDKVKMDKQATYKYVIHVEGNGFWADRLALQLFGTSAVLKQITPCGMFFEPLLEPYKHYIPVDYFFRDVVRQVHWARAHDFEMQEVVREAREFAGAFLSSAGIQTYVEELLSQYSALMPHGDIVVHPSAIKLYPIG
jgi:hypothetical protein